MNNFKSNTHQKKPQHQIIKEYLQAGNSITTYEAFIIFGITALSQRVTDLRNKGYVIESTPIEHNGRRFTSYSWSSDNDDTASDDTPMLTAEAPAGAYHEE